MEADFISLSSNLRFHTVNSRLSLITVIRVKQVLTSLFISLHVSEHHDLKGACNSSNDCETNYTCREGRCVVRDKMNETLNGTVRMETVTSGNSTQQNIP